MWKHILNQPGVRSDRAPLFILIPVIVLAVMLASCTTPAATPSPEDIQTAIAQTQSAEADQAPRSTPTLPPTFTPSPTPGPTSTPEPTPTPTPSEPISGKINTDFLNMRAGPGTMFEIINTFVIDTELTAISQSPDSEWVEVEIEFEDEDPVQGWMYIPLLELDSDPTKLPITFFPDAQTIQGETKDADGEPLPGIVVAVVLQNDTYDLRAEITSNQDGLFEVYVPEELVGTFDVQILSWECESPVVNLNCQLEGYIILEDRAFITLPQEAPIEFVFEATELELAGNLTDANDDAASGVTILAERDDGSISYGRSDALGDFSMPISAGVWDVYAITFGPYEEGEAVQIEVTDEVPEAIDLKMP